MNRKKTFSRSLVIIVVLSQLLMIGCQLSQSVESQQQLSVNDVTTKTQNSNTDLKTEIMNNLKGYKVVFAS